MKLAEYMTRENLDDEAMAEKVNCDSVRCDRTMILRFRQEKRRPSWAVIMRIFRITNGEVSANDFMACEAAE